jgi:hypothetical protein
MRIPISRARRDTLRIGVFARQICCHLPHTPQRSVLVALDECSAGCAIVIQLFSEPLAVRRLKPLRHLRYPHFPTGLVAAASGLVSPPIALALGLLFGFSTVHPYTTQAKHGAKFLLQASIVAAEYRFSDGYTASELRLR